MTIAKVEKTVYMVENKMFETEEEAQKYMTYLIEREIDEATYTDEYSDVDVIPISSLLSLCSKYGWDTIEKHLARTYS